MERIVALESKSYGDLRDTAFMLSQDEDIRMRFAIFAATQNLKQIAAYNNASFEDHAGLQECVGIFSMNYYESLSFLAERGEYESFGNPEAQLIDKWVPQFLTTLEEQRRAS